MDRDSDRNRVEPGLFREVIEYPFTDRPSVSELIGSIAGYLSLKKNI